jgi:hypothetical protein
LDVFLNEKNDLNKYLLETFKPKKTDKKKETIHILDKIKDILYDYILKKINEIKNSKNKYIFNYKLIGEIIKFNKNNENTINSIISVQKHYSKNNNDFEIYLELYYYDELINKFINKLTILSNLFDNKCPYYEEPINNSESKFCTQSDSKDSKKYTKSNSKSYEKDTEEKALYQTSHFKKTLILIFVIIPLLTKINYNMRSNT